MKFSELKTNALDNMQSLANTEPIAKHEHLSNSDTRNLESISESDSFSTPEFSSGTMLDVSQEVATTSQTTANALNAANSLSSADSALLHDPIWRGHKKHIFILSEAGKPIYSLHGSEDKLAILFGIIQALVSFVENTQDVLTSIHARGIQFVFMIKSHLIFVAASRTNMSVAQLQMQLK